MTAYRVIDDHKELENIGSLTHDQIDSYVNQTPFLVVSGVLSSASLPPSARYLVPAGNISFVDGGPGGSFVISGTVGSPGGPTGSIQFNDNGVFGGSDSLSFDKATSTLSVTNISASLTQLTDGTSFIVAGGGISVTTGSNGSITITNTGPPGDITSVNAGNGLLGGGTSGDVTLEINDSVVATVSGTTFTGVVNFNAGLSGSLTRLTDGSPYLVPGKNISIKENYNGSLTISSTGITTTLSLTKWMENLGEADGVGTVFTLADTPYPTDALLFYVNGVLQRQGIDYDYTLTDNVVSMNKVPLSGSLIIATYKYQFEIYDPPFAVWMEFPSGSIDGVNKVFTLNQEPIPANSLMFTVNGVMQTQGSSADYTLSGSTITTKIAPLTGSTLAASYAYEPAVPDVGPEVSWLEIPTGEADGVNNIFSVTYPPNPQSAMMFFVNGVLQRQGAAYDYTMVDKTVTMTYMPLSGSTVSATYPYDLAAIVGKRTKYIVSVIGDVPPNTDVSFIDGNLDGPLPDMSLNDFINDYDLYLNGSLLNPGDTPSINYDYFPGTSLANGQLQFSVELNDGDVLCLIPA